MQQQQQYPHLWLRETHGLQQHPAVADHYEHHQAGEQLQPNNPGPKAHYRPWNYSDNNQNQHVILPHRDMPAGLAHHNTEHGQIWRVGPRGFEDHPDKDQAPHDLQQAWKAHQKTLQGVQHVLVADNNLLGHLCPLASIARSMDTFARNIFVTFFFESNFSVHRMQTLLSQNLPPHLLRRCGTLAYQQSEGTSVRDELQRALSPYLQSHQIELSGCLFDSGSFPLEVFQYLKSVQALPSTLPCAPMFTTSALARLHTTEAVWGDGRTSRLTPEELLYEANTKYGKVEQVSQKLFDALHLEPKRSKPPVVACSTRALEPSVLLWLKDQLANEVLLPVGTQMHVKTRGALPDNLAAFVRRGCWLIATGSFYSKAVSLDSLEHLCGVFLAEGLNVLVLSPGLDTSSSERLRNITHSSRATIMVQQGMVSTVELFKQQHLHGALLLGGWGIANEALANRKAAIYLPTTKEQECTAHVMKHLLGEAGASVLPALAKGQLVSTAHALALQKALALDRADLPSKFNEVLKRQADKEAKEIPNVKYLLKYFNVTLK